jgi:hypothetical protein
MVGIIFLGEINLCPFLNKYVDSLKQNHMDYEIISWDRGGQSSGEYQPEHVHVFRKNSKKMVNPIFKVKDFMLFAKFAKVIINEKKYDKLVILTTLTGMLLYPLLMGKYKKKFIFDYRDVSYEFLPFYRHFLKRIIDASAFTCISSLGFKKYLPKENDYIMAHNFKYSDLKKTNTAYESNRELPIHISYIGVLRESEYLKQLIHTFGGDERFLLSIHGGGNNELELRECASQYHNVICTGKYEGDEKIELINQSDILCYNYPCSFINDPALANKYYDGLIFKRPFFANIDTYSGNLIAEQGVGIGLHYEDPQIPQKLFDYYQSIDEQQFLKKTEKILENVIKEDGAYIDKINQFFVS